MRNITKKMRISALLSASDMIEGHAHSGATPDDLGLTEEEFNEYIKQCKHVARKLDKMTTRLLG